MYRKSIPGALSRYGVILVVFIACANPAGATTITWGGGTGDWFVAGNWAPAQTPSNGDAVVINAGSVLLTNLTADLESLTMGGGTLTFSNWTTKVIATNVSIAAGTVTLPAAFTNNAMSNRVWIVCSNLTLASGASINVDARGYAGGGPNLSGNGTGATVGDNHAAAAGYGGRGGDAGRYQFRSGGVTYGSASGPACPGSGSAGGAGSESGGAGGGAVQIDATGHVLVNGTITADGGAAGGQYTSGGSGGGIYIGCRTFAGTNGLISADGRNGGVSSAGSGGGRIAVLYDTSAQSLLPMPSVTFTAARGTGGFSYWFVNYNRDEYFGDSTGRVGTLYFSDNAFLSNVIPHAGEWLAPGFSNWAVNSLTITGGYFRIPTNGFVLTVTNQITVIGGGTLELTNATVTCGGDFLVTNAVFRLEGSSTSTPTLNVGGDLEIYGGGTGGRMFVYSGMTNLSSPDYGALVSVTGDVYLTNNAWIYPVSHLTNGGSVLFRMKNVTVASANAGFDADARGFERGGDGSAVVNGLGTGFGYWGASVRNTGAGYGGRGGRSTTEANRGVTYGDSNAPVHPGSSGGTGGGQTRFGGKGGGLVRIEADLTATVNGKITANGGYIGGNYGGGGSGGGIYIVCRTFDGGTNGLLRADGGVSGYTALCGAGGGGRIAVVRAPTRHNYLGSYSVTNGAGGYTNDAEVGTIALVQHPSIPLITNEAPTNISSTNAWLIGNLTATGSPPTEVYVYWGTNDGQTVKGNWATNDYLGTNDVGWVTNKVYFLNASTRYYYRFYATNSFDHEWATISTNLTTLGPPIAVDNDSGATNITTTAATLRGEATGGNPTPTAYVFWGPTDGDTNKAAWSNTVDLGAQADNFSTVVTGLLANKTYYYRCYASNSYDSIWAAATTNFTTIPPEISINSIQPTEGNAGATNVDFAVTLSATSAVNVTVQFAASNGTATVAGGDFDATNGTLAIDAGAMNGTIRVVVNGDADDEYPYEEFYVNLSNAVNGTIGVAQGVCQVLDDDDAKQAKTWTGSGNWTARTNWSPAGMPGPLDDAVVASGSTTLSNAATVSSLAVSNGATFVFTNWTTKLTVASNVAVYGTVTLPSAFTNGVMSNRVWIACSNFTVASGGSINVDGKGYAGGTNGSNGNGPGYGTGQAGSHAAGAGHGGQGGEAGRSTGSLLAGGVGYGSAGAPLTPGSGGGSGSSGYQAGAGGGAVWIEATGAVTINGTVTANGSTGGQYTGGGSGGGIYITCNTLAGAGGTARANAGNGSTSSSGGGGRIAVIYDTNAQSSASVPAIVFSCAPGSVAASPTWLSVYDRDNHYGNSTGRLGTIYFPDTSLLTNIMAHNGILTIPGFNNWAVNNLTVSNGNFRIPADGFILTVTNQLTVRDGGRFELTNAAVTCGSLLLTNGAFVIYGGSTSRPTLAVNGDLEMYGSGSTQAVFFIYSGQTNMVNQGNGAAVTVGGDMFLTNNAWVYPVSHPTNGGSVMFSVSNLTIASANAGFNADARGFDRRDSAQSTQNGLGQGFGYGNSSRATGAGYGGRGGRSDSVTNRGATYGSADAPVDPGSSGGSGSIERLGSKGGGAVRISADDTVTVHGTITADAGLPGNYGGGGSGGGIYIACRTFSGNATGMLQANGGISGQAINCGAGSGGRIAVWRNADQHFYTGSYSVTNGSGSYSNDVEVGTIKLINNSSGGTMFKFF